MILPTLSKPAVVSRRVVVALALVAHAVVSLSTIPQTAHARDSSEAKLAVAANFTEPVKEIAAQFEKSTGHKLVLSFGATGQFYAQITQGAPFDILISADRTTPAKAIAEGHGIPGTAFTYAVGKLVLFSKAKDLVTGEQTLRDGRFAKIAIANPQTAPYGAAGVETMKALGVYGVLAPRIVQGNNISQAFQFVDTRNAELGFVALSQVINVPDGSRWIVPDNLYAPIAQDAVLLEPGAGNEAAKAFLAFLKGPQARAVIQQFGYGLAD